MVENQIPIISPTGEPGSIPVTQLNDARAQGYSIPMPKLQPTDLSEDKKVANVYDPSGTPGTIPADQLDAAFRKGYLPQSFAKPEEMKLHQDNVSRSFAALGDRNELLKIHGSDKVLDTDGNVLLKTLDNQDLSLPMKDAIPLLASKQVKFADPNFAALVDASKKQFYEHGETFTALGAFGKAIIPQQVGTYLEPKTGDTLSHAQFLAHRITDAEEKYPEAAALGTGLGIAGSLFSPEVALAGRAGQAIKGTGALATLGRGAVEGAIIVSPHAIAQAAIDKDFKGAVETLTLGAGGGALLNLGGKAISTMRATKLEGALEGAAREQGLTALDKSTLGTAEQQAGFLRKLGEEGAAKAGQAEKTLSVLDKMAAGSALENVSVKLADMAEKIPVGSVMSKVEEIGNKTIPLNRVEGAIEISRPAIEEFNNSLEKMADKSGNIKLPDLVRAAQDASEKMGEKVGGAFYQAVNETLVNDAIRIGTGAAEKADAKVASEWSQAVYNQQIAKSLPRTLEEFEAKTAPVGAGGVKSESKIVKLIQTALKSKAIHYIAGGVGHAIGGPIAGVATYGISHALEGAADKLAEGYLSNPKNSSKMTGWLAKQTDNPNLASYLVLDAKAAHAARIQDIGKMLQAAPVKAITSDPIKEMLGIQANGLSKQQQFNKLAQQLSTMASNPDVKQAHLKAVTDPLVAHPGLQSAMVQEMDNKIQYLYSVLPKNPNSPQPFTKEAEWKPTSTQMKDFESKLAMAQDPYMLVEHMKNGTITPQQVATVSVLNPAILQDMRTELAKQAYSGKVDMTYKQKLAASILMGESMAVELNKIPQIQAAYGQPQQGQGAPPGGGKPSKAPTGLDKLPGTQPTTSQRIANK